MKVDSSILRSVFVVALFGLLSTAGADDRAYEARSGPFMSAATTMVYFNDASRYDAFEKHIKYGVSVGAGAYINPYLSVEVLIHLMQHFQAELDTHQKEVAFYHWNIATIAHYPLFSNRFVPFAKFGAGEVFWDEGTDELDSDSASAIVFGAGIGYRITPTYEIKVGADYIRFDLFSQSHNIIYEQSHLIGAVTVEVMF